MTKEFEALKKIGNLHSITKGCAISYTDEYKVIKQALLELQAIKEAEPSEALECLKHIKKDDFNMIIATYPPLPAYNGITKDEMFDKVEQALLKTQELAKYKNLEEQLGCPLEVVFKAILKWVYYEDISGNITRDFIDLHTNSDGQYILACENARKVFFTRDYKQTWWLKKDKSE